MVIATSTGKVFGIDSDGGHIVWSRYLVEAMSSDVSPLKIFTSVSVSDGKQPEVVLLANRKSLSVWLLENILRIYPLHSFRVKLQLFTDLKH